MSTETLAGEIRRTKARQTGATIILLDLAKPEAAWAGQADEGGRWFLLCNDHSSILQCEVRRLAVGHMSDPQGWCETCREVKA